MWSHLQSMHGNQDSPVRFRMTWWKAYFAHFTPNHTSVFFFTFLLHLFLVTCLRLLVSWDSFVFRSRIVCQCVCARLCSVLYARRCSLSLQVQLELCLIAPISRSSALWGKDHRELDSQFSTQIATMRRQWPDYLSDKIKQDRKNRCQYEISRGILLVLMLSYTDNISTTWEISCDFFPVIDLSTPVPLHPPGGVEKMMKKVQIWPKTMQI